MTNAEFERIINYVERKAGIHLAEKRSLVCGRLDNYLAQKGFSSYTEYMNRVEADVSGKEMEKLIDIIDDWKEM